MSKPPNPFTTAYIYDAVKSARRRLDDIASGRCSLDTNQRAQQQQKSHDDLIALRTMFARIRNAGGAAHGSEVLAITQRIEKVLTDLVAKKSAQTVRRKRTPKGPKTADLKLRARYDDFCNAGRRSIEEFCESEHGLYPKDVDRAFNRLRKALKAKNSE